MWKRGRDWRQLGGGRRVGETRMLRAPGRALGRPKGQESLGTPAEKRKTTSSQERLTRVVRP